MWVSKLRFIDCRGTFGSTIGAKAFIRKPFTVKDRSEKIEPLLAEKLQTSGEVKRLVGILPGVPGGIHF
jgi:hypothetical protein